ncbi:facilitated trehalose transporter Tret1-like [Chrysoperla carnea]|uniref:facilitated trehalose transporter Tret1-like n=1 Tax=Chrysoperla carnea TaxID=189513 RepID=UPI001D090F17|nr:facilitated trehalose transporter Tret1-like [Chrysoperla carnea]
MEISLETRRYSSLETEIITQEEPKSNSVLIIPNKFPLNQEKKISLLKQLFKLRVQLCISLTASLLSCISGMHLGWIGPTILKLSSKDSEVPLTTTDISWLTMMLPLGGIIGPTFGSIFSTYFGRKRAILIGTIPSIIAWTLIFFATTKYELYAAQLFSGLTVGTSFVVLPTYLGEIASPNIRGILATLIGLQYFFGVAIESIIAPYVSLKVNALTGAVLPIFLVSIFIWMPESPYFYVIKRKWESAKKTLKILKQDSNIDEEFDGIKLFIEEEKLDATTLISSLRLKTNQFAIGLVLASMTIQEFSGINVTIAYGEMILNIENSPISAHAGGIILNLIGIFASLIGCLMVDKWGRRSLALLSPFGAIVPLILIGSYFHMEYVNYKFKSMEYLPLIGLILHKITFSIGMGPLPFVYLSETLSTNIKGFASVVACTKLYFILS